ncbi:hypothetical protein C2845_PM15G22420 [Panicum miliaceum]|uniref:Uncharacterized protein n=1 Tax=Panicum miliaceum TaxID=4540 RepID=A0A3L6Q539_PANMI|nr:hypothetical protein C2845_PM15G22420 [Panicum miliaceum]
MLPALGGQDALVGALNDGCSKGTPSPTGSSATAQMGSKDKETIDVEEDDIIQPPRSNARSNANSIATPDARSDRRLNWSIEEDIRMKLSKEKEKGTPPDPAHVVDVEDALQQRPMGHKKAKDERNGKRKEPEAISAISDKLDKFIEASSKAEKIAEVQKNLANKKLQVANEQTKSKMLDLYRDLLCAPTSDLSDEAKAERSKALECMTLALFSKDN